MNVARFVLPFVLATTGCYWSSPPSTPHRSTKIELSTVPALGVPNPRPIASKRLIVLGRFDSTAPQPIGGLYDKKDYSVSPLIRTYFYKDGAVEVFEVEHPRVGGDGCVDVSRAEHVGREGERDGARRGVAPQRPAGRDRRRARRVAGRSSSMRRRWA